MTSGEVRAQNQRLTFHTDAANQGTLNLLDGTIEVLGTLTNHPTGRIGGRGMMLVRSELINNGQIAFSGGISDLHGEIINNSAARIIVTGGGLATFYGDITHNPGADIRVSAGSVGVFLGAINGTGSFSGSGTKHFEGGGSAVGAISTAGASVVSATASLSASLIREDSLTVNGQVTINTSGGTSHLNELVIEGGTDAWDGVLDLKNNSLVLEGGDLALVTNQIRSGLYEGTGITSSAPGSPFRLGSMLNSGTFHSSFMGIGGLDGDEVLIRYTRIGDLNLDGTVSIADFIDLAAHFNMVGGASWQDGDVNYDGSVSISDFIELASNFNQSISGVAAGWNASELAMVNQFAASIGAAAVPEPLTLAPLGLALLALPRPRRRSR
jgi:hypothetical protein